jgi:large-conductance mechanosensitive channel
VRGQTQQSGSHRQTLTALSTARAAGAVTVNYGQFTENFLNFLIYALFLYIAIKKGTTRGQMPFSLSLSG